MALLRHLFVVAIREWRLGLNTNPVDRVCPPPATPGRERRLDRREEQRLFAALRQYRNPMLGWIVRLAIETGMRSGEIAPLRLSQVDLQRRVIRLGTSTKTATARTVPLSREAAAILREACARPDRPPGCGYVFFGTPKRKGSCQPYRFRTPWWKLKRRLALRDFHFHDLRHEAISRFVEAGLTDQQAAAISGHRSMQMLKRYTHLRAEDLVAVLDNRLRLRGRAQAALPPLHL